MAVVACLLACSVPSFAALGGDVSSVQADVAHMQGSLKSTASAAYTLHEIQAPNGAAVREYMSQAGTVFAVTWTGPWPPDLKQFLGAHFSDYQIAMQASNRRAAHGPATFQQSNLVVQLAGHTRAFSGRAYLVDQLPAGVALESIR
jgi:predicted heme/steroid binding protein